MIPLQSAFAFILFLGMLTGWIYVAAKQEEGIYFSELFANYDLTTEEFSQIGDGGVMVALSILHYVTLMAEIVLYIT